MSRQDTLVRVDRLQIELGRRSILKEVTFELKPGELLSVIGSNGSGKSTLLKALTGMVRPVDGTAEVLGRRLEKRLSRKELRGLRAEVGQVFQGLHLIPRLTVRENVLIGRLSKNHSLLTWLRLYSPEDERIAREALVTVHMADRASERVDRLSGGERQKVAMARAIAQEARIILADEPTANLDPAAAKEVAHLLHELAVKRNLGVITVVHSLSLLPVLGGRVLGLKKGQMQFDLPQSEVSDERIQALYADVISGTGREESREDTQWAQA